MWKWIVGTAVGLGAIIGTGQLIVALAGEVQTDNEAEIWRSDHVLTEAEKFKIERVDRVQRESDRIEYDLLDPKLTEPQVKFKERILLKNDAKIACIRDDKC